MFRIFKLAKSWKSIGQILSTIVKIIVEIGLQTWVVEYNHLKTNEYRHREREARGDPGAKGTCKNTNSYNVVPLLKICLMFSNIPSFAPRSMLPLGACNNNILLILDFIDPQPALLLGS